MPGRITLVGAGELMSAMSAQHRAVLSRLGGAPRPVFLDTTAGFETNVDAIVAKAVEYYEHHLQLKLTVARYRHRDRASPSEVAEAVAAIRASNLIFAGPGSPTYAIRQWRGSPVWDAVEEQFESGADLMFASAASITVGQFALPVYEIYKAGEDPYWTDGLNLFGRFGLNLAVVPHFDDSSGGENYDSRFCYMGARRFDALQSALPPEVGILGIDAYTSITFDPTTQLASVSGQAGVTLICDGEERHYKTGDSIPFTSFTSTKREVVHLGEDGRAFGYEFSDAASDPALDPLSEINEFVEALQSLSEPEKVELLARIASARQQAVPFSQEREDALIDLVVALRDELRSAKRYEPADRARQTLEDMDVEIGDSPTGSQWTRR